MKKYIIAMDSFKGCLSAEDACRAAMRGVIAADSENDAVLLPLADGGEGTAAAVTSALGGKMTACDVVGPYKDSEKGYYGTVGKPEDEDALAVIDTASASGIMLAKKHGLDPMRASTYGTGRQIKDILDLGYRKIIVGLGGSGTNDGGTGALAALGAEFYDKNGRRIEDDGGRILASIGKIDLSHIDPRLNETELRLMYDVAIPLTGERGASLNYARQKGADDNAVMKLECGMKNYADVIRRSLNIDPDSIPGTGAAGGLGCGLMLAGGLLTEGAPYILELTGFTRLVQSCDAVITGEGKTDFQTASGKLPVAVARAAKNFGKTVICVCGTAAPTKVIYSNGIDAVFSIANRPMPLDVSLAEAPKLIEDTCFNIANLLKRYEK